MPNVHHIILTVVYHMGRYLGIDVGATWTRAVLTDDWGNVLERAKIRTGADPLGEISSLLTGWTFDGVGVGSIGPLDLARGWVVNSPNSPTRQFPLVEPLKKFGKPVVVANDCVAAVWGEYLYKHRRDNLVYMTISTGVGFGAVVNGFLLLGKDGNAHELGHAVVDFKSQRRCGCGGLGHLEAYVGGGNVAKAFGREPAELFRLYRANDRKAVEFIDMWLDALAAGVATAIAAYDPEVFIVGGSIALSNWDIIAPELERRLEKYLAIRPPEIKTASFGDDEVAIGAAALVRQTPEALKKFGYPR